MVSEVEQVVDEILCVVVFFFFQAEDGIRDYKVTGVQTCALPIYQTANFERVRPPGRYLKERIVQRGVASGEPRDDQLPDLLADREAGEQRVDGYRGDRGWETGEGLGRPPHRLTAGTSQHGSNYQEPMRWHSLSL